MIAYIDTSVLLRVVLKQSDPLKEWDDLEGGITSSLLAVEGYRTFDQLWHRDELTDSELAEKRVLFDLSSSSRDSNPRRARSRTGGPTATYKSRDAGCDPPCHRDVVSRRPAPDERPIYFATHDVALAVAAKAMHFDVIGVTV